MSESVQPQHPNVATEPTPRVGTLRALWRLREYAGPAMPAFAGSMAAALVAQLIALTIPQVLAQIVDGPLADGDAAAIAPLTLLVFVLGTVEALLYSLRRWLVVGPGTKVEARMRNALYAKLQDLPVSFHDRWPSGQLLSRAVSDLGLIRRWLSFGLVLTGANIVIIVVGVGILMSMNWMLGLVFLVCSLPLWWAGWRFEGQYSALSRLSQDQAGDLATAVEESVHGIRVLKAFGRGKHALSTFRAQAESLRRTEIEKARLDAQHLGLDHHRAGHRTRDLPRGRGVARRERPAQRRRARRVLRDRDRAGVADRVDRLLPRVRARRAHRDRPVLRHPRQREHDRRPRRSRSTSSAPGASSRSRACASATRIRPTASATCSTASTS